MGTWEIVVVAVGTTLIATAAVLLGWVVNSESRTERVVRWIHRVKGHRDR